MIYRSGINNRKGVNKVLITLVIVIILVMGLRLLFPKAWSNLVLNISAFSLKNGQGINNFFSGGNNQVEDLKKQVQALNLELNDKNLLVLENNQLKEILGRNSGRSTILGVVLSKPAMTPYDTFVIDVGSNQGIKLDDLVLAGSSTAVGKISEVNANISKVIAFSSPNFKYPIFIGEKNIQAEAIGQGNGNYKVVLPEGSEVKIGDNIIIPSINPTVFGVVERIVQSDQPSFINVLFKSPISLNSLYYVEVVK